MRHFYFFKTGPFAPSERPLAALMQLSMPVRALLWLLAAACACAAPLPARRGALVRTAARPAFSADGHHDGGPGDVTLWGGANAPIALQAAGAALLAKLDASAGVYHANRTPVQSKIRDPLFAARTLNATAPSRVTLSLRQ